MSESAAEAVAARPRPREAGAPGRKGPGIWTFAVLYFVETLARASLLTVVPLQAYALIQDESTLSFLYTGVALAALVSSQFIPLLIRLTARRAVFTAGALGLGGSAIAFGLATLEGQAAGMLLRAVGSAMLHITVSTYILDHIDRRDFVRNDAMRLGLSTLGWTAAPVGGVWLHAHVGPWAAFGACMAAAALLLAIFWAVPMGRDAPRRAAPQPSPLRTLLRFWRQPRLRLAWLIAFSRSAFWSAFFIYGPVLMVSSGMGEMAGGWLSSAGNAMIATVFFWARVSARIGIRAVIGISFLTSAACLVAAGAAGSEAPLLCAGLLLLGTLLIVPLDGVGGAPFFRAVHPHERAEMSAVYRTYLDAAELIPSFVYGLLLTVFGLGAVFVALAALLAVSGALSLRYLNPRMR